MATTINDIYVRLDVRGERFGRLVAVMPVSKDKGQTKWLCQCDCGARATINIASLRNGSTRSCGCLHVEVAIQNGRAKRVHGHRADDVKSETYNSYRAMLARTQNPNNDAFDRYGGRGITVCDRWLNGDGIKSGFECFLDDMGERPAGKTLDRENNDGNYEPSNCRWINDCGQMQNRRDNIVTSEEVAEIRRLSRDGIGPTEIGRRFGITVVNAHRIANGQRWGVAA